MEPVNSGLSSTDIYNIAKALRIRSITTVALCEHGDRASTCYMGAYFKPLGPIAYSGKLECFLVGVSDNREWVRYIPKYHQALVDAHDSELPVIIA